MPRKKQTVQKQKRQKAYRPGELSGDVSHIKPKGAFRVFTNYKLFAIIGAVVLTGGFLITALRSNQGSSTTKTSVRGDDPIRATPEPGTTSTTGAQPAIKQYTAPPVMSIDVNKTYTATIKTSKGDVVVQLNPKEAPEAVNNFVFLANDHFYDGTAFFRVIADRDGALHYAQAGDPTATGSGGPGYELPYEITEASFDQPGVLAMAKPSSADTLNNGSQFFFTLQTEPTLDGKFTAFGEIKDGLSVLQSLTPRDPQLDPNAPIDERIESITISES